MSQRALVLGGGLTGVACAYELALAGVEVTVLEREQHPGGMASSFIQDGAGGGDEGGPGGADGEYWSYDFGPHRFHTTDPELIEHVQRILDGNCRKAHRLSRILLFGKFFDYPLQAGNVLRNLPPPHTREVVPGLLLGPLHRAHRSQPPQRGELRRLGAQALRAHAVRVVLRAVHGEVVPLRRSPATGRAWTTVGERDAGHEAVATESEYFG